MKITAKQITDLRNDLSKHYPPTLSLNDKDPNVNIGYIGVKNLRILFAVILFVVTLVSVFILGLK